MNPALSADNDRMALALLIAGALHVLLIFGVGFEGLQRDYARRQVEVTLVVKPGQRPVNARHEAQLNQRGTADEALRERPAETPVPMRGSPRPVSALERAAQANLAPTAQPSATERNLARLEAELQRLQDDLNAHPQSVEPDLPLEPRSDQRPRPYVSPNANRVRRIDSVAAFAAIDAAYLVDWRNRVEAVGNEYYPDASRRYGIYGSLEMLVTVRSDGSLDGIQILRSSGQTILDEAAIRIVRAAAPFAPFPAELRANTDKLEIQRTWQFEQNPLSSD